jgi:dTDP-glucose 4,6-dehydratase
MRALPSRDLDHILQHTVDLFRQIRGARIFMTGGTGLFGKWLLESLLHANDKLGINSQVMVLTRDTDRFSAKMPHLARHEKVSLLRGDVRSFDFPQGPFTHVLHCATQSSEKLNQGNPLLMLDTIVEGSRHTLEFARSCGAEQFLFTSSGAVYGKQPLELSHIPEEYSGGPDPLDRQSAYAEGKRLAEHLCSLYSDSTLKPKIARCFTFIGPHLPLDIHFAIGNFLRDALRGGPIIVKGDGTAVRSYLYMADLVIWLLHVFLRGETLRPYNVGSSQAVSIAELANTVAGEFSPGIDVSIAGTPDPQKPAARYVPDTQRAKKELSLEQLISLSDAINRTKDWHRS